MPDTVESGIPSTSAISAPVIRTRLSAAITCTRGSCTQQAHQPDRARAQNDYSLPGFDLAAPDTSDADRQRFC